MKTTFTGALMIAAFTALLVAAGCGPKDDPSKPVPPKEGQKAPEKVSLSKDIVPVLQRICGSCHAREGGNEHAVEDGAFFEKKEDILERVGKFIVAGKPEESGFLKVLGGQMKVGEKKLVMPPPDSGIEGWNEEELALFEDWILEGAKDN